MLSRCLWLRKPEQLGQRHTAKSIQVCPPALGNPEESSQKAKDLTNFRLCCATCNPTPRLGEMLLISRGKNAASKCGILEAEQGPHKGKADPDDCPAWAGASSCTVFGPWRFVDEKDGSDCPAQRKAKGENRKYFHFLKG